MLFRSLGGLFFLSRARSLSLSLSVRNSFEVKIGTKFHFRSQSLFFSVNGNQFPENSIFWTNQTPIFPEVIFTQNKHTLNQKKKVCLDSQSTRVHLTLAYLVYLFIYFLFTENILKYTCI